MVYLYLEQNQIKALSLKKSLFGQYEVNFFEKNFQVNLIDSGKIGSVDILASAVKEIFTHLFPAQIKDKEIVLILPQEFFHFLRTNIPVDIAPSAVTGFIQDKITTEFSIGPEDYNFDFFYIENGQEKKVNLYVLEKKTLQYYYQVFSLLGLKIINIIPETAAYFKLFDKTLRQEKKENILFVHYDKINLFSYLYDSYGLIDNKKFVVTTQTIKETEEYLKKNTLASEKQGRKINRLVLSGSESEKVRQDTFTKNTGAWTNPLKKIVANFYQNYLKLLTPGLKPLPVLSFDACFGAFIFTNENKNFSLLKNSGKTSKIENKTSSFQIRKPVIKSEYLIFVFSFAVSFIFFVLVSKLNLNLKLPEFKVKPTPTATPTLVPPTPTPTPSFKKEELKIKVLNGSGTAGKASDVKTILKKAGYQEILTGNADNFEYKNTVIQVKKTETDVFSILKTELKDYTNNIKKENLEEKATADVIIIIGQDFK